MSEAPKAPETAGDEIVGRLLLDLQAGRLPGAGEPADEVSRERRAYLETLGLLAESLEPMAPSRRCRERLLAALVPADAPGAAPAVQLPPPPARSASRWALPIAASLAVLLAGLSGWLLSQVAGQRATIDELARRLDEVEARAPVDAGLGRQLGEMRSRLELVTQSGVEVCSLRPMDTVPEGAASRGVLFVAPDHQHWYLAIEGLAPCSEGRSYQLWFMPADGEPVSAGTFDVVAGVRLELSSDEMPANTRAVTVTLEPAGGSERPTGRRVLHGEGVMRIL